MTTPLEEVTINNEQLRREVDLLKTDNTQLRTNNDEMKDENKQLKANNDKQQDRIGQLRTEVQELKVSYVDIDRIGSSYSYHLSAFCPIRLTEHCYIAVTV